MACEWSATSFITPFYHVLYIGIDLEEIGATETKEEETTRQHPSSDRIAHEITTRLLVKPLGLCSKDV